MKKRMPIELRQQAADAVEAFDAFRAGKLIPEVALDYNYEPGTAEIFLRSIVRQYGAEELAGIVPDEIVTTLVREPPGFVDREANRRQLVEEIKTKQAVVGRFLTNGSGQEFPPDAIHYPKQIAEAKARFQQLTGAPYHDTQEAPVAAYQAEWAADVRGNVSNGTTLLAEAQIIQTELRDPATASEALESQAFSLERDLNVKGAQASSTTESAVLRGAADRVETDEMTAEESREELAHKAELYAGLVARDYRTATDAAVEKFASGVRSGSSDIDLSQAYAVPAGVSLEAAEGMAHTRHASVGAALQPLFSEAESLGISVRLGSASLAETVQIQQQIATPKRGIRV